MSAVPGTRARGWRRWLLFLLLAGSAGCGASAPASEPAAGLRFAPSQARAAQRGAPDLFARAERARADALAADDADARAEHARRARFWLAAALAETQRIAQARAAGAAEARVAAAELERARLERARVELEAEARRAAAAEQARERLLAALERAELDAVGESVRDARLDPEREQAAAALLARAELLWSAAVALGSSAQRTQPASAARPGSSGIAPALRGGASSSGSPQRRLAQALAALQQAESALGDARGQRAGPSAEERAALLELARDRRLEPEATSRGVVFALERMFEGGRIAREGQLVALRLAHVLRAHPHGPVQLEVVPCASGASERRQGEQHGKALAARLAGATERARLRVTAQTSRGPALVLPAYAEPAPAAAPAPTAVPASAPAPAPPCAEAAAR